MVYTVAFMGETEIRLSKSFFGAIIYLCDEVDKDKGESYKVHLL